MARRPLRSLFALLLAGAIAGCSAAAAGSTSTTTLVKTTTTSGPAATSTTTQAPATTSTSASSTFTTREPDPIDALVTVPEGEGPFPAVVLVHGGGWVTGDPSIMGPLADYLNAEGFLTVNARYALATLEKPAFPEAIDDVACAVRFAATHQDSDGTVAVIGHSAGAHIGSLVALTGDSYTGDCAYPGTGVPDAFIGLAGPYDVSRLGPAVTLFFGGGQERLPETWELGNPLLHTDSNTTLSSLIMYGENDGFVPASFALDFNQALADSGGDVTLELVEGARHNDLHNPALVGDLIVTWLER